ncbi:MAG: glycosyltransferase [Desulfobacteraceae bacterium]|nr:glycosyltransferase [Desulfobacteraceae bacterium]MBC2718256.1 glycosyltransferase [Desulfobacteraceae bacterium]
MNTPTFSIVTPSYNQGQFIEETIKSVLSQEGNFYIDYIVMDGGSTDNSVEIIKKYEQLLKEGKWPINCRGIQYRWASEEDRGQSDAINKGFEMAKGSIFAWLNSDDTYMPGAVSKAVDYFNSNFDVGMVYGKAYYIDEANNIIGKYPTEPFDYKRLADFTFVTQSSTFFKKEIYFAAGGLNPDLHYSMDYDLWIRIANISRIEYLPAFLSTYRLQKESKTVSYIHALKFQEEQLRTVFKHYKWAPPNRIYGYCYHLVRNKTPDFLLKYKILITALALMGSLITYIRLNKKIKLKDIKMINRANINKLFKDWTDIYLEY